MDIEYKDLIGQINEKIQTEEAKAVLDEFLNNIPNTDTPFEALYAIIKQGFFNTFPFSYLFKTLVISLGLLLFLNIFKGVFKNNQTFNTVRFFAIISISSATVFPTFKLINNATVYMRDISTFLGVAFPMLGILTAGGGNVISAKTSSLFFSLLLGGCQLVLNTILPTVITLMLGLTVIDVFLGEGKFVAISTFVKNTVFGIFSIAISLFYIIISAYGQAAKGADSISARTIKLMVGNAIPIIGGTIGETIKFVTSGIINLKNAVGISAVVFILSLFLPILICFFGSGIILNLMKCICDFLSISELKNLISHIKSMLDFSLAIFASITVAAIININAFISVLPVLAS